MISPVKLAAVGAGEHRSGWPYCMGMLSPIFSDNAPYLFDDFCERTFMYDAKWNDESFHKKPWIGVLHHPPDMPDWYFPHMHLRMLHENERWLKSLPYLRMLLTMAPAITEWCKQQWPALPVATLRHPTGLPTMYWSPDRFLRNEPKKLVQVGWFLRDSSAIHYIKAPDFLQKCHLDQNQQWPKIAENMCIEQRRNRGERPYGDTRRIYRCDDIAYDLLLATNVVFMHVLAAGANNAVVECIMRNTPICINRAEGPVFYLGKDYPLFFDTEEDICTVLTVDNIMAAHEYLKTMEKQWIYGEVFRESVVSVLSRQFPALQIPTY